MEQSAKTPEVKKTEKSGGLYKNVRMSVKSANILVGVLIAVFVIVFLIVVNNNGFTVKFESNGGTDVKAATLMYGDKVETEAPTREGYVFTGWYLDRDCTAKWDAADTVNNSITLYAGWEKAE